MGDKIQGEGDYQSARRFNKQQQEFVKKKWRPRHRDDQWANLVGADEQDSDREQQSENDNADQDAVTVIRHDLYEDRTTK